MKIVDYLKNIEEKEPYSFCTDNILLALGIENRFFALRFSEDVNSLFNLNTRLLSQTCLDHNDNAYNSIVSEDYKDLNLINSLKNIKCVGIEPLVFLTQDILNKAVLFKINNLIDLYFEDYDEFNINDFKKTINNLEDPLVKKFANDYINKFIEWKIYNAKSDDDFIDKLTKDFNNSNQNDLFIPSIKDIYVNVILKDKKLDDYLQEITCLKKDNDITKRPKI